MNIQKLFFSLVLIGALTHSLSAAAEQNAEQTFKEQRDFFLLAVLESNTDAVEEILPTISPELLNAQDDDEGWSALLLAVDNGDLMMVKLLLTQHQKMNFLLKNKAKETALDIAKRKGLVAIASELLKYDVTQSMFDMGEYINSTKKPTESEEHVEQTNAEDNVKTEEDVDSDSEEETEENMVEINLKEEKGQTAKGGCVIL